MKIVEKSLFSSERTKWINENEWMNPRWFLKRNCWKIIFQFRTHEMNQWKWLDEPTLILKMNFWGLSDQTIELFMFSPQDNSRFESWFDFPRMQQLVNSSRHQYIVTSHLRKRLKQVCVMSQRAHQKHVFSGVCRAQTLRFISHPQFPQISYPSKMGGISNS